VGRRHAGWPEIRKAMETGQLDEGRPFRYTE
jgi:hypothetical protein